MPVIKLTPEFIETQLTCPEGKKRIEYCDKGLRGLYIEVRGLSPGTGTYYLRYKNANGKTCHQKIGRTADIGLDDARVKAKALKAQITLGANPREEQQAKKAVLTFAVFFEDHYMPYAKQRKRTWKRDKELFDRRLKPSFGDRRLNQITRAQIQVFHTALRGEGLAGATCDHQVKLLRRALNLAVDWGMLEKNPAAGFKLFNDDNMLEIYMDDQQLQRLLNILRTDKNRTVCRIALFLLSTGARLNEALQAQWQHVDKDNRVWRIPASTSKSKRVRSVPLNDSALAVLEDLGEGSGYLFVNRKTGKPYTTIHKVWNRLRNAAGLPNLRLHDLRHQYASFLVNSGRTLYEVQQILGHSDPTVTQRYAHLSSRALQDAANSASVAITRARNSR